MSQQTARQSIANYYIDPLASSTDHGDSSVNGTIAWALSQLPVGGGIIQLVPGDYNLLQRLDIPRDNVSIIGCGKTSRLILDQSVTDDCFIDVQTNLNFTLKDLQIYGSGGSACTLPAIIGTFNIGEFTNLRIDNVYFNELTEGAIDFTNLTFSNITNCNFENIDSTSAIILTSSLHNNIIDNNIITYEEGILLDTCLNCNVSNNNIKFIGNGAFGISIQNNSIDNNVTDNNIDGNSHDITFGMIYCEGGISSVNYNNFSNNTFRNVAPATGNGITISNGIENNIIGNIFDSLTGNGVELVGTTHYHNITGNNFNSLIGISIKLDQLSNFNNIIGNNISGVATIGIQLAATSTYNNISENHISGASGSGVELTATSNYNKITNNEIYTLTDGIKIDGNSDNNVISLNYIASMGGSGILINNANCNTNSVFQNKFLSCTTANITNSGTDTLQDMHFLSRVAVSDADRNTSALSNDYLVAFTALTAPRAYTISSEDAAQTGRVFIVKDESGDAGTHTITVSVEAGTIDGAASVPINGDYSSITLYAIGDGNLSII